MEEQVSQGYGSTEELMAGGGGDAELAGPAPEEQGAPGGDMEAMIAEGVQAYMESQDPQIAVEVVMMLAEAMGIGAAPAGAGAPAPGAAPAGPPTGGADAGMPMAKHGGKFGFFDDGTAMEFQKFISK